MTDEYIDAKIAEAMTATGNNRHDAQKLLITWAVRDQALLLRMTKPHLKAIATSLIDHATRTKTEAPEPDNGPDQFSRTAIDDLVAASTGRIADKRKNRHIPPPKSTERQASTMRRLAAAFTKKKK